ncbi:MAG: cytochrome b/b6 domain-containing protein [Anaerolineales bacterium]|nr:cytochrome b/b6 domain-containing protein [Anaerolineales bacterium]
MTQESAPARYHPVHVVLHWLIAAMVLFFLVMGSFVMSPMPNSEELPMLGMHSAFGPILGVLLLIRLGSRFFLKRPAPADAGHPLLNFASKAVHFLLYVGVILMLFSGANLGQAYDLPGVLSGDGSMPEDLFVYPQRSMHGTVGYVLLALVVLHFGAAMYHQFIRKDNLLSRMWFGKR